MKFSRKKIFFSLLTLLLILTTTVISKRILEQQTTLDIRKKAASQVLFSDGFEGNLSNWTVSRPDTTTISTDRAYTGSRSVRVRHDGLNWASNLSFIRPTAMPGQGIISVWIYDDLTNPSAYVRLSVANANSTQGVSIGIRSQTSTQNYTYCPDPILSEESCMDTKIGRTQGWHQFKLFVTPKGTYGKIDDHSLSYLASNQYSASVNTKLTSFSNLSIGVIHGTSGYFYFDDVYVHSIPAPGSDSEISVKFLDVYLNSYGNLSLSSIQRMLNQLAANDGRRFLIYDTTLDTAIIHATRYLKNGNSSDLNKAIAIIGFVDGKYSEWKEDPYNTAAVANPLVLASWLTWNNLDSNLQNSLKTHLIDAGNFYSNVNQKPPFTGNVYACDSGGESNLFAARFMHKMYLAFNNYPQAQTWFDKTKLFAFHSLTKNETYGGYTSRTIYDDNLFDNHQYHPHPKYGMVVASGLGSMQILNNKFTGSSPSEFSHNAKAVAQKMIEYIDFRNFTYKGNKITTCQGIANTFYPSGQDDAGEDALSMSNYFVLKNAMGINSFSDSETGFSTNDLARHASEYAYYVKDSYLFRPVGIVTDISNVSSTEFEYWRTNTLKALEFVSFLLNFDSGIKPTPIPYITITPTPTPVPNQPPTINYFRAWRYYANGSSFGQLREGDCAYPGEKVRLYFQAVDDATPQNQLQFYTGGNPQIWAGTDSDWQNGWEYLNAAVTSFYPDYSYWYYDWNITNTTPVGTVHYYTWNTCDRGSPQGCVSSFQTEGRFNICRVPTPTPLPTHTPTPRPTQTPTPPACNSCYNFNGSSDGRIDVQDVLYVANKWRARQGDSNYNVLYDIYCPNGQPDGTINILDVQTVANKWRQSSCTPP